MGWLPNFDKKKEELLKLIQLFRDEKADIESIASQQKQEISELAKQKSQGFPWLAQAYSDYFYLNDMMHADWLDFKSHPAAQSAEHIREVAQKRRIAEKLLRVYKYQLDYYEALFPWLAEFKEEDFDDLILQITTSGKTDPEQEESNDPVKRYLTQAEYLQLPVAERNQRALDRYWKKKKARWELGRDYERYIGYQFENKGYHVQYQGIIEGFEDLGRDLIAIKGDLTDIIQCKYWSKEKTIHEKHIFQLYGTTIEYKIRSMDKQKHQNNLFDASSKFNNIHAHFITSTVLSEKAKEFAEILGIHVAEHVPLKSYPCIKCNVSMRNGEKIYHLPFDQQYDKTLIKEEKNECYATTVKEAESLGFRRAFRWHGTANSNQ